MSQNFQNPFSMWTDMNKQMVDMWNSWASSIMPQTVKPEGDDEIINPFDVYLKSMSAFIPNKAAKDAFDRFFSSYQMFGGLPFSSMTDQFKSFFAMPLDSFANVQQFIIYFFKPWIDDSSVLQEHLAKAMLGDREAYSEFLKEWAKVYKNSFAKALQIPAVGSNRAAIEKMMKLLDDYVNFIIIFNEFNVMISNMMNGAMEKLLAHLAELQTAGTQPQTFMEFYKIWSKFYEQAFSELYATDEFSKLMNETMSAGSQLKILCDNFTQDILAFLPMPNRREFDDVAQEVYQLRKTVKKLEKDLKSMKGGGDIS